MTNVIDISQEETDENDEDCNVQFGTSKFRPENSKLNLLVMQRYLSTHSSNEDPEESKTPDHSVNTNGIRRSNTTEYKLLMQKSCGYGSFTTI